MAVDSIACSYIGFWNPSVNQVETKDSSITSSAGNRSLHEHREQT